jgi:hypothetical protein
VIEIGKHRTGNGGSYIDLHAQSGVDFSTRIVRNSGADGSLAIANSGTGGISIDNQGAGSLRFRTNGVERMNISSTGGISTSAALTVGTDITVTGGDILDSTGTSHIFLGSTSVSSAVTTTIRGDLRIVGNAIIDSGNTERISLGSTMTLTGLLTNQATYDNTAAGSNVVVTSAGLIRRTSSSVKYKKDIENLEGSIVENAVDNLRPVWYRSINPAGDDKPTWSHIGLIAEEVHEVEPRLVRYRTAVVVEGENGEKVEQQLATPEPEDVDYARLSVILLAELKAQKATIQQLVSRIEELELKLNE